MKSKNENFIYTFLHRYCINVKSNFNFFSTLLSVQFTYSFLHYQFANL